MTVANGKHNYKVIVSKLLIEKLYEEAKWHGLLEETILALQMAQQRLEENPHSFGEPMYRHTRMHLLMCTRLIAPIVVIFGIHDVHPLVFISGIRLVL